jgi:hypothetical protein
MPSRRQLLVTTASLLPLAGCSLRGGESGNVQIPNRTGQEVRITLTVRSVGGLFSAPAVVYEETVRQFPTDYHRVTLTDVV